MNIRLSGMVFLFLLMLAGCDKQEAKEGMPLFKGVDVRSGKYYLVAGDTLFDNPQVLHQYKNQIRIKKSLLRTALSFGEGGGCDIALWQRGKERAVACNPKTYDWFIPKEMWKYGKPIRGLEQHPDFWSLLQRASQLKDTPGVTVNFSHPLYGKSKNWNVTEAAKGNFAEGLYLHAPYRGLGSGGTPKFGFIYIKDKTGQPEESTSFDWLAQKKQPEETWITSVLFPQIILETEDFSNHRTIMEDMARQVQDKIVQLVEEQGIQQYFIRGVIDNISNHYYGWTPWEKEKGYEFRYPGVSAEEFERLKKEYYQSKSGKPWGIAPSGYQKRGQPDLKLQGYEIYTFALRIICDKTCTQLLAVAKPQQWLSSPVRYDELSAQIKKLVEEHGMDYDRHDANESPDTHAYRFERFFENILPHERYIDGDSEGKNHLHPQRYWQSGLTVQGKVPDKMPKAYSYNNYELRWWYDLNRALTEPYPEILKAHANPKP